MKTRTKVLIAILAGLAWFCIGEYAQRDVRPAAPRQAFGAPELYSDDTSLFLLRSWYAEYNEQYFQNKLPKNVVIDLNLRTGNMASTSFPKFEKYHISFDPHYVASQRAGRITLLHEMCHIKTWGEIEEVHGPRWRACMLEVDMQGEFRDIIIDKLRKE